MWLAIAEEFREAENTVILLQGECVLLYLLVWVCWGQLRNQLVSELRQKKLETQELWTIILVLLLSCHLAFYRTSMGVFNSLKTNCQSVSLSRVSKVEWILLPLQEQNSGRKKMYLCMKLTLTWLSISFQLILKCCCLVTKLCLTLCDPTGSSIHGILECVAIPFSKGSSQAKDWTWVSWIGRWILYYWATRETHFKT